MANGGSRLRPPGTVPVVDGNTPRSSRRVHDSLPLLAHRKRDNGLRFLAPVAAVVPGGAIVRGRPGLDSGSEAVWPRADGQHPGSHLHAGREGALVPLFGNAAASDAAARAFANRPGNCLLRVESGD